MMSKLRELEQTSRIFRIAEYLILAVLLSILVLQIVFPSTLAQMQLNRQIRSEDCRVVSEEYNLYMLADMSDEGAELYKTYVERTVQNAPLYKNDYNIIIVDDEINSNNPYTQSFTDDGYFIMAKTNKLTKTITVHKNYITSSLQHEIAHAIDYEYNFSRTSEFKELYNKVEHTEYLNSDAAEYFAEGYQMFLQGQFNKTKDTELIAYYEDILGQEYAW